MIHLVDEGSGARDELDVVAVEDELILDLLGPQDGDTVEHVHLPHLTKGNEGISRKTWTRSNRRDRTNKWRSLPASRRGSS
jgi:hypothetical protein